MRRLVALRNCQVGERNRPVESRNRRAGARKTSVGARNRPVGQRNEREINDLRQIARFRPLVSRDQDNRCGR